MRMPLFRRLSEGGDPRPGRVNHISLGTVCHIASALREVGLRAWSGPFDWVFSTPSMVRDCLRDDFASFLDPLQLRTVPDAERVGVSPRQCRHLDFEARYGLPTVFSHHDPLASASDRASLERAVARLRDVLTGPHINVFYILAVDYGFPLGEIEALASDIASYPSRNALVQIEMETDRRSERSATVEEAGGRALPTVAITLRASSRWLGLRFADPADDALFATSLREAATRFASLASHSALLEAIDR